MTPFLHFDGRLSYLLWVYGLQKIENQQLVRPCAWQSLQVPEQGSDTMGRLVWGAGILRLWRGQLASGQINNGQADDSWYLCWRREAFDCLNGLASVEARTAGSKLPPA